MNFKAKFLFSIGLVGLLCLMLPGSLRADTVYTYTGEAYKFCGGDYSANGITNDCGPYALSLTFDVKAGTPLDNLIWGDPGSNITADVTTFSFTDGLMSLTNVNVNAGDYARLGSLQTSAVSPTRAALRMRT